MCFFSIIVPVYNVEKYIDDCIKSLLNQDFKDYEIILINDGSKDNSLNIIKSYEAKYNNIKVLSHSNKGLSYTRNIGIKNSRGKYLLFVDSDDFIEENILSKIYNFIDDEDVLFLNFKKYFSNKLVDVTNYQNIKNRFNDYLSNLVVSGNFISSACNKAIKKEFLINNNLFFKDGIKSEDIDWSIRLICVLNNFDCVDFNYYYYRQLRDLNISSSIDEKHIKDYITSIEFCYCYIEEASLNNERKIAFKNYLAYQYLIIFAYYIEVKDDELKDRLKKFKFILDYDMFKKVNLINKLMKIIGFNFTAYLLNIFVRKIR